jgi:hypothetical protein
MDNNTQNNAATGYTFEKGQTSYFLRFSFGRWELISKRKNMSTMGQVRFFDSLQDIESNIKSLSGLSATIGAEVAA